MCHQVYLAFVLGVFLALIQNGYAIQCWKCNSDHDPTCRDYFNVTRIQIQGRTANNLNYGNSQVIPVQNYPHLEYCDERYQNAPYNQKNVCLKVVEKGSHGLPHVKRECRLVSRDFKEGSCPDDISNRNANLEFCGTCSTDQCNSAKGLKTSVIASLSPIALILLFRK